MAVQVKSLLVNGLKIFWVLLIVWYEYTIFSFTTRTCEWPDAAFHKPSLVAGSSTMVGGHTDLEPSTAPRPHHVLVIADPQIVDQNSYPTRGALLNYLTRIVVDLNLRKNWQAALATKPDSVVFLGDMMDNGRNNMTDAEYEVYYRRFKSIFHASENPAQYFIPGNHDVGLGNYPTPSKQAYNRYTAHFGVPNHDVTIANHTLAFLDAPGYADENARRHGGKKDIVHWNAISGGALDYTLKFAARKVRNPVVLLTHIPLWRPDGKSCGPLRERGTVRPGAGIGYQNTIEKRSSELLLESFRPAVIFSGDDHDYCEYTHQIAGFAKGVREVTVKTLSMVMNVRRPGFQLLSLAPAELWSTGNPTFADAACLLPDQLNIYLNVYLPLLFLSIFLILALNFSRMIRSRHNKRHSDSPYHSPAFLEAGRVIQDSLSDDEDANRAFTYSSTFATPMFPVSTGKQAKHVPGSNGWRRVADESHLSRGSSIVCANAMGAISVCCRTPQLQSRRKRWLTASVKDIRDIAIFPVCTFILITCWVVAK